MIQKLTLKQTDYNEQHEKRLQKTTYTACIIVIRENTCKICSSARVCLLTQFTSRNTNMNSFCVERCHCRSL